MTKRDLLSVAVKITGLVIVVREIMDIPSVLRYLVVVGDNRTPLGSLDLRHEILQTVWSMAGVAIMGVVLIAWSEAIARLIVRQNADSTVPSLSASPRPWFGTASRVVGLLSVAEGLPLLVAALIKASAVTSVDTQGWSLGDKFIVLIRNMGAIGVDQVAYQGLGQVIVGVGLIWGAERLSRWVFPKKGARKTEDAQDV